MISGRSVKLAQGLAFNFITESGVKEQYFGLYLQGCDNIIVFEWMAWEVAENGKGLKSQVPFIPILPRVGEVKKELACPT